MIFFGKLFMGQNTHIQYNNHLLPSENIYCLGNVYPLSVSTDAISTNEYSVSEYSERMPNPTTAVSFRSSDANIFSRAIDLPFDFNFYGKIYRKVVVGRNGRLLFSNSSDIDRLYQDTFIDKTNTEKLPSVEYNRVYSSFPERELPMAQIFAGYTNIDFHKTREGRTQYRYSIDNGEFILKISDVVANINGRYANTTYDIIVKINKKNEIFIKTERKKNENYNAILGLQDETATRFLVPNNKFNNNQWSNDKGYKFSPIKKRIQKVVWQVNNVYKHTGLTYNYQPISANEVLSAEITYTDGSTEKSEVKFKAFLTPQIRKIDKSNACISEYLLEVVNPENNVEYTWRNLITNEFLGDGNSLIVKLSGEYYAQVKNCDGVRSNSEKITIPENILPPFNFVENRIFKFSDNANLDSKKFDLSAVVNQYSGTGYTVEFFQNETPINGDFEIKNGDTVTLTMVLKSTVNIGCEARRNFILKYQSFPNNSPLTNPKKICFEREIYTIEEFKNDFPALVGYEIHFSKDGIHFDENTINPKERNWVKLSKNGFSSESIKELKFNILDKIEVKNYTQFKPHCESPTEYFDLNIIKNQLEYGDVKVKFYTKYENGIFSNEITNLQYRSRVRKVYIKIYNSEGCEYQGVPPTLDFVVYRKPTLLKNTQTLQTPCGGNIVDITLNINDFIPTDFQYKQEVIVRYFNSNGIELTENEIKNFDVNSGVPYAEIYYTKTPTNNTCYDRIDYEIIKSVKPIRRLSSIYICNENIYPLEDFKNKVIELPQNYVFYDENMVEISSDIAIQSVFRFYIKNKNTGCLSDLQTINFEKKNPISLINNEIIVEVCDTYDDVFDGRVEFDLDSQKSKFTNQNSVFEYFRDENLTQRISPQGVFGNETIFVKISDNSHCPTIAKLYLKVNKPTKSSTLLDKYYICYGNSVIINAGNENINVIWSDGRVGQQQIFDKTGKYYVTLTNSEGCSYTHKFEISDENQPKIKKINQSESQIEIMAEGGVPPYEYSFDGGATWRGMNVYAMPTADKCKVQVRSVTGCVGEPKTIANVKIANVITPNDDGKNDVWRVDNLEEMTQVEIIIVDRYGKPVFHSVDKNKMDWDGKSNGRPLPTATYWYVVKWYDPIRTKNEVRSGWILLQNRD